MVYSFTEFVISKSIHFSCFGNFIPRVTCYEFVTLWLKLGFTVICMILWNGRKNQRGRNSKVFKCKGSRSHRMHARILSRHSKVNFQRLFCQFFNVFSVKYYFN